MNEGMFSQIKALLGELIKRHDRLIELMESQMTQPVPVARDEAEDKKMFERTELEKAFQERGSGSMQMRPPDQAPATPKTMPKEEPVVRVDERNRFGESTQQAPQTWPAQEQNKPNPERRATGAPMKPAKK